MFKRKILSYLEEWRDSYARKPLVLRGARQVGKTTLVNYFGKSFKQYIYFNLETEENKQIVKKHTDVHVLVEYLFFKYRFDLNEINQTLLFIDEIQEVPEMINMLRYFKEEKSELAVITAGSMLETLLGKNITFPVGRVEYLVLRPLSFEEFLIALNEEAVLREVKEIPLKSYVKDEILKLFHQYALIGGMPEIVEKYARERNISNLRSIYQSLINSYLEDAEKYARSEKQLNLIRYSIEQVMLQAGKRITYAKFGNAMYKSNEISEILRTIQKTHLIKILYPTSDFKIPLLTDVKKSPRIQFLDTGLINYLVGLHLDIIGTKDLNNVYQGVLIEHLIGQELLAHQTSPLDTLHYWVREKSTSSAEIDFLFTYKGKVYPIEVKSGPIGKIKSLQIYMDEADVNLAIRFYAGDFSVHTAKSMNGKTFYLMNLPYFLATQLTSYVKWFFDSYLTILQSNMVQEGMASYGQEKKEKPKKVIRTKEVKLSKKHFSVLKYCDSNPRSAKDILENALNLSSQSINKRKFINYLFELGYLEWTDKENPKSKNQKYKLTDSGLSMIHNQF